MRRMRVQISLIHPIRFWILDCRFWIEELSIANPKSFWRCSLNGSKRRSHKPKITGSNPVSATNYFNGEAAQRHKKRLSCKQNDASSNLAFASNFFIRREWSKVGSTGSYSVNRKVRFLLSQPKFQTGHSLIGKTVFIPGISGRLPQDYRLESCCLDSQFYSNFYSKKAILPEQTRTKILRGQKNADNSLLLFATNTFVFCLPERIFRPRLPTKFYLGLFYKKNFTGR
ncbi:MAG: hypothetical protein JWN60_3250 [Acidobacteria bacterium]|nr:hypothetical protein [Acidobacteriota bacterium]